MNPAANRDTRLPLEETLPTVQHTSAPDQEIRKNHEHYARIDGTIPWRWSSKVVG